MEKYLLAESDGLPARPLKNEAFISAVFILLISISLSSCLSSGQTSGTALYTPTPAATMTSTEKPRPQPSLTATLTLPATLEPQQARETIRTLLQKPPDCEAPCFWGIIPGQTTLGETQNIFTHLGLQLEHTDTQDAKEFYSVNYDFDNGLSITTTFTIQNKIVKNISLGIIPETREPGVPKDWLVYSPETLINRYGLPSKVSFTMDWGFYPSYTISIYFNAVDLIVQYHSHDIGGDATSPQVCPITDEFDVVRIWLGQDPEYPPLDGIPLEDATSMTMEGFSKRMTGAPDKACVNLKKEMFP